MHDIDEATFIALAMSENCRACLSERADAVSPVYRAYPIRADKFMTSSVFPTWRTDKERSKYIGSFETPPTEAFRITFAELARLPALFAAFNFDARTDYLKSTNIIAFHCTSCGVKVNGTYFSL
jgi:hypothetical protein